MYEESPITIISQKLKIWPSHDQHAEYQLVDNYLKNSSNMCSMLPCIVGMLLYLPSVAAIGAGKLHDMGVHSPRLGEVN